MSLVVVEHVSNSIEESLTRIFNFFGGLDHLVEGKDKVFVKVDAFPLKPHASTSPEIVASVVELLRETGVGGVYVMDGAPHGFLTRYAFKVTGLDKVVKRSGGKPLYLDEQISVRLKIGEEGYDVLFPRILYKSLLREREENLYLSLPRLKASRTTTVSLSLKSQLNLIRYESRLDKLNHQLHQFITDIYRLVRPDFTVIDGLRAVVRGGIPPIESINNFAPQLNMLIGGVDSVAVDAVGARILGYTLDEVKHLKLADEQGLGYGKQSKIKVIGEFPTLKKHEDHQKLPEKVKIIEGREMACPEGCKGATLTILEALNTQQQIKTPLTVVYGKGVNIKEVDETKPPVLVVGPCAIKETAAYFKKKHGKENVHLVEKCGHPAKTLSHLLKITGKKLQNPLNPLQTVTAKIVAPIHIPTKQKPR
ncbi:MAG: DUF362 domain-containing protein [Candidatus Jordarchaeales archaeon]